MPPTTRPPSTRPRGFPPQFTDLQHGGLTWAAILAVVPQADSSTAPPLRRAANQAASVGYETGPTDCDQGAAKAVGLPALEPVYSVSLYFATRADADQFRSLYQHQVLAISQLRTYCLD